MKLFTSLILLIVLLIFGIYYQLGNAQAQWLEFAYGADIPWYQAAFLNIQITN